MSNADELKYIVDNAAGYEFDAIRAVMKQITSANISPTFWIMIDENGLVSTNDWSKIPSLYPKYLRYNRNKKRKPINKYFRNAKTNHNNRAGGMRQNNIY
jgi:hypothetical protein